MVSILFNFFKDNNTKDIILKATELNCQKTLQLKSHLLALSLFWLVGFHLGRFRRSVLLYNTLRVDNRWKRNVIEFILVKKHRWQGVTCKYEHKVTGTTKF